ncbi:MAG: hypothetical protein JSW64_08990 [Candidatus Zixiibacteriota bacterium]|nr:MAG: hypothetical protein JSW64_08990 [candidate division Zixibacteria bacterium]
MNNDYIETWGSWGFLDDKIKSGYGFSAELLYSFFREVSIGVGLIYIGGSSNKDRVIGYAGDDSTVYHDYLKSRIYGYLLSARYYIRREKIDFSFGIGDSFLFGKVSRHHTSTRAFRGISLIENDYYSTGIGLQLFFGVLYRLTDLISYNMETGYRYFKTGDLVEKGSKLAMRSEYIIGTEPPINLDYSGPYISAGLMFRVF